MISSLMVRNGMDPISTLLILLVMGIGIGLVNGVLVVGLRISPLIVTLAMMLILRGIALEMTKAMTIGLPEDIRRLGNLSIGPVFVDILVALGIMILVQVILVRTPFGRRVVAIGNDVETAARLGIQVNRMTIATFVMSSFLATIGGVLTLVQVGSSSSSIGSGLEFTAVSAVVIGGISLFGGEGSIVPGALRGVLILEIIRNGLNHVGAGSLCLPVGEWCDHLCRHVCGLASPANDGPGAHHEHRNASGVRNTACRNILIDGLRTARPWSRP